jgi:hypothetical protein
MEARSDLRCFGLKIYNITVDLPGECRSPDGEKRRGVSLRLALKLRQAAERATVKTFLRKEIQTSPVQPQPLLFEQNLQDHHGYHDDRKRCIFQPARPGPSPLYYEFSGH